MKNENKLLSKTDNKQSKKSVSSSNKIEGIASKKSALKSNKSAKKSDKMSVSSGKKASKTPDKNQASSSKNSDKNTTKKTVISDKNAGKTPAKKPVQTKGIKIETTTKKSKSKNNNKKPKQSGNKDIKNDVKLLPRTRTKINKMIESASKYDGKMTMQINDKENSNKMSEKTKDLINIMTKSKERTVQKQETTDQNKNNFQIDSLGFYNKQDKEYVWDESVKDYVPPKIESAEGIIKKYMPQLKATSKNADIGIKANVVGKKQDIKIIANKHVIFAGIVVLILLVISIASNFVFYAVYKNKTENLPITVTKTLNVQVYDNSFGVSSVTVPKNILPNLAISQSVSAYAITLDEDMLIRAKGIFVSNIGDEYLLKLKMYEDWVEGDNGYYYYIGFIKKGLKVDAIKSITTPSQLLVDDENDQLHVITFLFETVGKDIQLQNNYWDSIPQELLDLLNE